MSDQNQVPEVQENTENIPIDPEEVRKKNIGRVLFTKVPAKKIVSYHSSTILADPEPKIQLTEAQKLAVVTEFNRALSAGKNGLTRNEFERLMQKLTNTPLDEDENIAKAAAQALLEEQAAAAAAAASGKKDTKKPPPAAAAAPATAGKKGSAASTAAAAAAAASAPIVPIKQGLTPTEEKLKSLLKGILQRYLPYDASLQPAPVEITESMFLTFFTQFYAPSYYYGERLRLYAGRAEYNFVQELLLRGVNINTANGEGLTALHYACQHSLPTMIDTLLGMSTMPAMPGEMTTTSSSFVQQLDEKNKGSSSLLTTTLQINAQDKNGWSPLHTACHFGSLACVEKLLSLSPGSGSGNGGAGGAAVIAACDLLAVTKQGKTCLHIACGQNRTAIVNLLLTTTTTASNQAKDLLAMKDASGQLALHDLAFKGHTSMYQELLRDARMKEILFLPSTGSTSATPAGGQRPASQQKKRASVNANDNSMNNVMNTMIKDRGND